MCDCLCVADQSAGKVFVLQQSMCECGCIRTKQVDEVVQVMCSGVYTALHGYRCN